MTEPRRVRCRCGCEVLAIYCAYRSSEPLGQEVLVEVREIVSAREEIKRLGEVVAVSEYGLGRVVTARWPERARGEAWHARHVCVAERDAAA